MNPYTLETHLRHLVTKTNGRIFTCTFKKRTDGTIRRMTCRTGVVSRNTSKTTDPDRPQRDLDNGLLTVFDVQADGYRCIPLANVTEITVDGETFRKDQNDE